MRISDWSSDVCSSDLQHGEPVLHRNLRNGAIAAVGKGVRRHVEDAHHARAVEGEAGERRARRRQALDRKSDVEGKGVSVRVDLGGRRIIKKKKPRYEIDTDNKIPLEKEHIIIH